VDPSYPIIPYQPIAHQSEKQLQTYYSTHSSITTHSSSS
jgi:hypothetical protein